MTNQSNAVKRNLRRFLLVVTAVVFFVTIFVNTAYADSAKKYDVTIVDGQSSFAVTTTETEPIEILNEAGITVTTDDKLDITGFVESKGGVIVIDRFNKIYLEIKDSITVYGVYSDTVEAALKEIGFFVGENDRLNYALDEAVTDGMVIRLENAVYATVNSDGESKEFAMLGGTVEDLLALAGVELGEDDYTSHSLDAAVEDGLSVSVYRVEYKEETVSEEIKYSTEKIDDSSMEIGTQSVVRSGANGKADVTYKIKYVNGEYDSRTEIGRNVTQMPINEQIKVGTKIPEGYYDVEPNGVTSWNGYNVGDTISGRYSHYCACSKCNGNSRGITTSGLKVQNGMADPHYVACNWLPLGSVINVDGQNYTVADRGGSGLSKKGRIDIFTPQGHAMCYKLGVGNCSIKIVRLGW